MAGPLRFRRDTGTWTRGRIRSQLLAPLDDSFGATLEEPWFSVADDRYDAVRFEMDNGDFALFCFRSGRAYWLGNTETPEPLWRTNKETFAEAPYAVSEWAQREFLAELHSDAKVEQDGQYHVRIDPAKTHIFDGQSPRSERIVPDDEITAAD